MTRRLRLALRAASLRDAFRNALRRSCRTFTFVRWFEPTSRNAKLRCSWWREVDSNHRRREPADLQSAPVGRLGIPPNEPCILYRIDRHVNGGFREAALPDGWSLQSGPRPVLPWQPSAGPRPAPAKRKGRPDPSGRPQGSACLSVSCGTGPSRQPRRAAWTAPSAAVPTAHWRESAAAVPPPPAARSPSTRRCRWSRCCSRSPC